MSMDSISTLGDLDQAQTVKFFINSVETAQLKYFELRFNPNATDKIFMTLIQPKFSVDMKSEAARAVKDGASKIFDDWESFRFWVTTRKNPHLVNREARIKLQNFRQGNLTIEQTMKMMRAIDDDILDYPLKQDDFNIAFCNALNKTISEAVTLISLINKPQTTSITRQQGL